MSKTITLTSKRDSTPYTWTGEDDTYTFANLPYGEYDVRIEESGYKTKTHTINHQGEQTYQYTLEQIVTSSDTERLLKQLDVAQITASGKNVYYYGKINEPVTKIKIQGDIYTVVNQTDVGFNTRFTLDRIISETVTSPIELYTTA